MADAIKQPSPVKMRAITTFPQLTVQDQQNTPTTDTLQAGYQAFVDSIFPGGATVTVHQE